MPQLMLYDFDFRVTPALVKIRNPGQIWFSAGFHLKNSVYFGERVHAFHSHSSRNAGQPCGG